VREDDAMTDIPAYLQPFVLPVGDPASRRIDRVGELDFYRPDPTGRAAAILFVHGGPGPPDLEVQPRDWPVYQGYATAAAQRGVVGVTVNHSLIRGLDKLAAAADDVEAAVGVLRADPQVDPNRIALWFFSGAGLLAGEWLDSRPDWLRCIALTYPLLTTPAGIDELVSAVEVIGKHPDLPVLLTRVGLERKELAEPVEAFVAAGGAALDIIDVPKGQHGFDMIDHTAESRTAVTKALDWTTAKLGVEPADVPIPAAPVAKKTTAPAATAPAAPKPAASVPAAPKPAASIPAAPKPAPAAVVPAAEPVRPVAEPAVPVGSAGWTLPSLGAETPAARVVAREHSAYEARDLEGFLATYSPTAYLQLADGTIKTGRRELREYYRPQFEAGRWKAELTARMTVGDWVVDQTLWHGSDAETVPMIALYHVEDGAIVEVRFVA
jgi:dienelactone hydrolase